MWQTTVFSLMRSHRLQLAMTAVTATALGLSVGFDVASRTLESKYLALSEKEIREAKEYYAKQNKVGEYADPKLLALKYEDGADQRIFVGEDDDPTDELRRFVTQQQYASDQPKPEEEDTRLGLEAIESGPVIPEEVVNIFEESEPEGNFDYEVEMRNRTEEAPYVITHDEYMENEKEYTQVTLTYYEDDDVLADEQDKPIDDTDGVVGNYNLNRFGHGSKDNNIVYIRNDRMEIEAEVVRSKGGYAQEVLGFRHSEKRTLRRFRSDDE